jgi:Uma2 family endonuclease
MVTLQLRQLSAPPGQRLLIQDLSWGDFENILAELGDKRSARLLFSHGVLEIITPLPEHEVDKEILGDMVKIMLEAQGQDFECFGSTTFKKKEKGIGLEPDQCFYIQNHLTMRGKRRVNLTEDPPPDLALEIDVTSATPLDIYASLGVPEVWIYEQGKLSIYCLHSTQYQPVSMSPTFPDLPIIDLVADVMAQSQAIGRSPALRSFRTTLQSFLS